MTSRKHVLVVDDDPDAREIFGGVLAHAGHDVTCVANVEDAESAVAKRKPDAVTLDWRLPDGAGIDLLRTWRRSHPMARVPVAVITAFSESEYMDAATKAGADAFVVKPCAPDVLTSFISAALLAERPTRRILRTPMDPPSGPPAVVFSYGRNAETATLHRIDARRWQALCSQCMRFSPIQKGSVEDALREIVALGWVTGRLGGWACPVCWPRVGRS